jgi:hypothetical protein
MSFFSSLSSTRTPSTQATYAGKFFRMAVGNCALMDCREPFVAGSLTSTKPARAANSFMARDSLKY